MAADLKRGRRYSAAGRSDASHNTIVFGGKCAFAYSAAAAGGDGFEARSPAIGFTYANDASAKTAAAIHGARPTRRLARIVPSPNAAISAVKIIDGRP